MKEKTVARALFTLLLSSMLILSTTDIIRPVKADNTITINADGSVDPPTAPLQREGSVYALTANINEAIIIQRNNTLLDGKGYTVQGNGVGQAITINNAENVTVKDTRILNFSQGIHLRQTRKINLINNTITNNTYAILADQSPETTIANNSIKNNNGDGIFITASPDSLLVNNTVADNGKWGIYLGFSDNNTLGNNTMRNNRYNFGVSIAFFHNIDNTNTVDGKPIYYWINQQNRQVPPDAGYVAIIASNNIEAKGLDLTRNGQGIVIVDSTNIRIENSNISEHAYFGVYLTNSDHNTINNNTITKNDIGAGISIASSTGNTIKNNTLKDNSIGISLFESNDNNIHHNNFINNTRQAINHKSGNTWDSGKTSGGNYWNDYEGLDEDGDAIGDIPYIIDDRNRDRYPLMHTVQEVPQERNHAESPLLLVAAIAAIVTTGIAVYLVRKRKTQPYAETS